MRLLRSESVAKPKINLEYGQLYLNILNYSINTEFSTFISLFFSVQRYIDLKYLLYLFDYENNTKYKKSLSSIYLAKN